MPTDPIYDRITQICLALPETELTMTWGSPHYRVCNKIFAGYGIYDGIPQVSFRTDLMEQADLIQQPRFSIAAYTGKYGGTTMRLDGRVPWKQVEELLEGSWRIVAPKRVVTAYDAPR